MSGDRHRLDSWKSIAAYLKRDVRTAQRWEKNEGLPVRRHQHNERSTVYAFKSDLDVWLAGRTESAGGAPEASPLIVRLFNAHWHSWALTTGIFFFIGAVLLFWFSVSRDVVTPLTVESFDSGTPPLVAVLPFSSLGTPAESDYVTEGLTEEIITQLGKLDGIHVISRTNARRVKRLGKTLQEIASELGATAVLEGSVLRGNDQLRINCRLYDAATGHPLWAREYRSDVDRVFDLPRQVAKSLAEALHADLTLEEVRRLERDRTEDGKAFMLYLKGRSCWKRRTPEDLLRAKAYFEKALELDGNFSPAYVGLADTYRFLYLYAGYPAAESLEKAKEAALQAVKLEPRLAEAHLSLAVVLENEWKWEEAEAEFRRALEIKPNDALARHWFATFLTRRGRLEEALNQIRQAYWIDYLSVPINTNYAWILHLLGRTDEALTRLGTVTEIDPDYCLAHSRLGLILAELGRFEAARHHIEESIRIRGVVDKHLLGYLFSRSGNREEALEIRRELLRLLQDGKVGPADLAVVDLSLGDTEQALDWLQQAFEEHDLGLNQILTYPIFSTLESEPEYVALLRRHGRAHP